MQEVSGSMRSDGLERKRQLTAHSFRVVEVFEQVLVLVVTLHFDSFDRSHQSASDWQRRARPCGMAFMALQIAETDKNLI